MEPLLVHFGDFGQFFGSGKSNDNRGRWAGIISHELCTKRWHSRRNLFLVPGEDEQIYRAKIVLHCHPHLKFLGNICFVNDNDVIRERMIAVAMVIDALLSDIGLGRDYFGRCSDVSSLREVKLVGMLNE